MCKKVLENRVKRLELTAKSAKLYIQNVDDGIQKWVNLNTFCSNLTVTIHSKIDISHPKMGQLVGFLLHPPLPEISKKLGKMLEYTPHFQSAFGTTA